MDKTLTKIASYIFVLGVAFAVGETIALEFAFFNSSTYIDFLTKSVKAGPLYLILVFVLIIIYGCMILPIWRIGSFFWGKPKSSFINILLPLTQRLWKNEVEANTEPAQTKQRQSIKTYCEKHCKMTLGIVPFLFAKRSGQIISILLTVGIGFATIAWQDETNVDAVIYLEYDIKKNSKVTGNLLATNSSSVAIYSNDKLYILPLKDIKKIEYNEPLFGHIRKHFKYNLPKVLTDWLPINS